MVHIPRTALSKGRVFNAAFNAAAIVLVACLAQGPAPVAQAAALRAAGSRNFGQIGDGQLGFNTTPYSIPSLSGAAVAAGYRHALAVDASGRVWAWGENSSGALGNGTKIDSDLPVPVLNLTNVVSVKAGLGLSVALLNDGTVWKWASYQLDTVPVPVLAQENTMPIGGITQIAAGEDHILALAQDGTLWGWGFNEQGQLGLGTTQWTYANAVRITTVSNIRQISAGDDTTVIVKNDGTVWAWGDNYAGQLGNGTKTDSLSPVQVMVGPSTPLTGATYVATGSWQSFAVLQNGTVWNWGRRSGSSEVSYATQVLDAADPTGYLTGAVAVECGYTSAIIRKVDNSAWGLGWNGFGQLGIENRTTFSTPVAITSLQGVSAVECGYAFTIALQTDGSVFTFGSREAGSLGDGVSTPEKTPVDIPDFFDVKSVDAEGCTTIAVKTDGTVWVWGCLDLDANWFTPPVPQSTPLQVLDPADGTGYLTGAAAAAAGANHFLVLKTDGSVWAWGANNYGQLGINSDMGSTAPVQVQGLSTVTSIAAGYGHSLALQSDGTVWAWGYNHTGQLGIGTIGTGTQAWLPQQVHDYNDPTSRLTGISAIASGQHHCFAVKGNGTALAWGNGDNGVLGTGSVASAPMAQVIAGLGNVAAIAGGGKSCAAVKSDGTVWRWGSNFGTISMTPIQVMTSGTTPLLNGVAAACGYDHCLVLQADGHVWGMGYPAFGSGVQASTSPLRVADPADPTGYLTVARGMAGADSHSVFLVPQYAISATAGPGGSISPAGVLPVAHGEDLTVAITTRPCSRVVDVQVDGTSIGAVMSHTFPNVTSDHTIHADFAVDTFTITTAAGANGTVSPAGPIAVQCGGSASFAFIPVDNYRVADVVVDGTTHLGPVGQYTFDDVTSNHGIEATFTTFAAVTVVQPNGGEVIPSGSTYLIKWGHPSTAVKFNLSYTLNGTSYTSIASGVTGTSYSWTAPKPLGNTATCRVKVVGLNNKGKVVETDVSDNPFTIEIVKVTAPDGGEAFQPGTQANITWNTNATAKTVNKVSLRYSVSGAAGPWIAIADLTTNPGIFAWTVPAENSSQALVQVELYNVAKRVSTLLGSDMSNGHFSIAP